MNEIVAVTAEFQDNTTINPDNIGPKPFKDV